MPQKTKKYLLAILIISFLISISYSFYWQNRPSVDAKKYDEVGWNIAQGRGYQINPNQPVQNDYAILMVGPGYQFFLSGIYYLFGHSLKIIWFLQALMLAMSGYFAFLISQKLFQKNWHPAIGLVSAGLIALSPDLILANSMILTESLGIFLMSLAILLILKYESEKKLQWLIGAAFVLSFAVMARSVLVLIVPIILIWLLLKKKIANAIIFALIIVALFTPWTIRNYKTYNMLVPFNLAGHMDLWWGNRDGATGELDPFPEMTELLGKENVMTIATVSAENGKSYILNNPLKFSKLVLKRISIYFSFIRPTGWWPYPGGHGYDFSLVRFISVSLSSLYSILLFISGITGVVLCLKTLRQNWPEKTDKEKILFFIASMLIMPLGLMPFFVETRYRYPIYPFLAVFAGYFFYYVYANKIKLWKWKPFLLTSSVLILNSIIDILLNIQRIIERI